MAKIVINENKLNHLVAFEQLLNEDVTKKDIADYIKNDSEIKSRISDIARETNKNDKDLEKKIKNITADVLHNYFKILWQRSAFLDSELRK